MAYKKLVAEKINKLKEAKNHLEEAEKILSDIQHSLYNEKVEFNIAKNDTESAIRYLNCYMELVRHASPFGSNDIYVPERRYI